jgi:peptidoglycan/LPS O-acetylase OafA/YrhL
MTDGSVVTAPATTKRLGYRPELDGVRGLAVLAIFLFHMAYLVPWLHYVGQGGFLSVDVFFVLSGMLITEILVSDFERRGTVSLRSFYDRRARRLLPALFVFIVVTVVYYQVVHGEGRATTKGLVSVVTYVTAGHFYGPFPDGVSQAWTLVVEWEFYFIWPVILVLLLRRGVSPRRIGYLAAGATLAVALARAILFHVDGGNYILSYHFAVLRFEDLLAGCAVGLIGARPQASSLLRTLGLAFIVVATLEALYSQSWVYYFGLLVTAGATAIIVQPRIGTWWFDRVLASRPAVWVGTMSYSFYLWSVFTVSEVTRETTSWPLALRAITATVLSFALAWVSYRYVEERFRVRSRRAPAPGILAGPQGEVRPTSP